MEKVQLHQWCRILRSQLSYKNATLVVCLLNFITALLLLHGFFFSSSSSEFAPSLRATSLYRHIKESEDRRLAMVPVDLIKRVREIGLEVSVDSEPDEPKDLKQTAAVDLISRLNNLHSYSDAGNTKALEEWRIRKMERARQRTKNGTSASSQS